MDREEKIMDTVEMTERAIALARRAVLNVVPTSFDEWKAAGYDRPQDAARVLIGWTDESPEVVDDAVRRIMQFYGWTAV